MSTQDQPKNQKCHIASLPDELLSAVFTSGSASATLYDEFSFPMVVSMVSLLWRQIAINTSSLWASIYVDFWTKESPFRCNIPLFVERSKMQSLSINIHFTHPPFTSRSYRELSDAITKNTHRIREIVVYIESLSHFHEFASPFNTLPFPILTRLEIDSIARKCLSISDHVHLLTGAKHIRSMVFPRCLTCGPLGPDLTHLEIRNPACNVEQLRALFQASPSLHTLIINKLKLGFWEETDPLPIMASSLHTLNVTVDNEHMFEDCICPLPHLVTPNLINLAVKSFDLLDGFHFSQHFCTLPKIEKLKISGFTLTQEDAFWIQKWSTLTHIELIDTYHTCLWSNSEANSSSDPWRNLNTVTVNKAALGDTAQMAMAISRSYTQSPRTITFNVVDRHQGNLEELQSDMPNVVFKVIQPEFDPLILYDTDGTDYEEDDDIWSDGSRDDMDAIDYELDAEFDPYYTDYYDTDYDSFDEDGQ